MKIATFIGLLLLAFISAAQPFQLEISVTDKSAILFLRYFTVKGPVYDSSVQKDGKFRFRGMLPGDPHIGRISDKEGNSFEVWLEKGLTKIKTGNNLSVTSFSGSANQDQFSELTHSLRQVKEKNKELDDEYENTLSNKDNEKRDKLLNENYPALFRQKQKILGDFIRKHPASLISAYKFDEFAGDNLIDLSVVEPVYTLLTPELKAHPKVKQVEERLAIAKLTSPGMDALDFSQNDTLDNPINLSSFKGKFLLIDFWAGWCVPCRAENPHLRQLYARYQPKGFEILGVSLDGERKRWTHAIRDDQLTWPQVSDLKIFDNAVAKKYGITSIPQNILISPHGKIIAKNLRGSALENKLKDIFK